MEVDKHVLEGVVDSYKAQVTGLEETVRAMKEQVARMESSGSSSNFAITSKLARPSILLGNAPSPAPSSLGKHNRPASPTLIPAIDDESADEYEAPTSTNKRARRATDQSDRSASSTAEVDNSLVIDASDDEEADVPTSLPKPLFGADFFPPPPKNGPITALPFALIPSSTTTSRPQTGSPSGRVGRLSTGAALRSGAIVKFGRKIGGNQSSGSTPSTSTLARASSAPTGTTSLGFASPPRASSNVSLFAPIVPPPTTPSSYGFPARPTNTSPVPAFSWGQTTSSGQNASSSTTQPGKAPSEAEDSQESDKED